MDNLGHDLTEILVTGAAGFLGGRVLGLLRKKGLDVVGTGRSPMYGLRACDLTDAKAVSELLRDVEPRTVIHCAASVPRSSYGYTDSESAANSLRMVENLLQGPRRILFTSSMTVYPDDVEFAHEEAARVSGHCYGASKLEAERRLLMHEATDAVVLRLPGFFGRPRQSGLLFNAARAFASGRTFRVDAPAPRWSAIHVDDAAAMIMRALDIPKGNHVLNVGYEGRMATADAVDRLAIMFGREKESQPIRWFGFDLTRMHALLGGLPTTFDERLSEMADWCRTAFTDSRDAASS